MATSAGIDWSTWYRYYLFELITGQFHTDYKSPLGQLPLVNPFEFGKDIRTFPAAPKVFGGVQPSSSNSVRCKNCDDSYLIGISKLNVYFANWEGPRELYATADRRIKFIALADCPNAYAAVTSISAPPREKATRLLFAHIREDMATTLLSYFDGRFDLADVWKKAKSTATGIWLYFKKNRSPQSNFPR